MFREPSGALFYFTYICVMEKYLRINSLAVAKAGDTTAAPGANNQLKGSGPLLILKLFPLRLGILY